jgi:predicted dehydrogenase
MSSTYPDLDFKPEMPQRLDHGIGIVGAGGIVNYAHLPAYAQAGFKVAGITDKSRERAEKAASDHKIPKVYSSLEELVGDPEVEIVDIAVYPWETLAIGEQAIRAGKHVLCQKPD